VPACELGQGELWGFDIVPSVHFGQSQALGGAHCWMPFEGRVYVLCSRSQDRLNVLSPVGPVLALLRRAFSGSESARRGGGDPELSPVGPALAWLRRAFSGLESARRGGGTQSGPARLRLWQRGGDSGWPGPPLAQPRGGGGIQVGPARLWYSPEEGGYFRLAQPASGTAQRVA